MNMNKWMSNSLPNLFTKSSQGNSSGKSSKAGSFKKTSITLDLQHVRLYEYFSRIESNYCGIFAQLDTYHYENARLRDCGDEISLLLAQLSKLNAGLGGKKQLEEIAKQFALVEDHRNAEVQRLKAKVLDPLAAFGTKFKAMETDMSQLAKAVSRENRAKQKLDRLQLKGLAGNAAKLEAAKRELRDAAFDLAGRKRAVGANLSEFERTRLVDLQTMLREFVQIETLFHAKVLNAYNSAWKCVRDLRPEDDWQDFRKIYLQSDAASAAQQVVGAPTVLRNTNNQSVPANAKPGGNKDQKQTDDDDDDGEEEEEEEEDDVGDDDDENYDDEDEEDGDYSTASPSRQSDNSRTATQPAPTRRVVA